MTLDYLARVAKNYCKTSNARVALCITSILIIKILIILTYKVDIVQLEIPQYYYLRSHPLTLLSSSKRRQQQQHQRSNGTRSTAASPWPLAATRKRVAYFRMDPQTEIRLNQVDGDLCTHVILAFARLDSQGNLVVSRESDRLYLAEVNEFKRKFPHVKVMISVMNEQEFNGFPKAANNAENRQRFARSTIEFLKQYNLDGIDLDWEFPNFPTTIFASREWERAGLTKIIRQLRLAIVENFYDRQVSEQHQFQQKQQQNSYINNNNINQLSTVEPYLLTVAIAAQEVILKASYELGQMANLCDWFNVMSYDYYLFKPYTPFTGPNSPLYSIVDSYVPVLNKLSLAWTVERLIGEEGIEADKIVMGIPTYARAYRLMFRNTQATPFTLAIGSKTGRIQDYLDYREVCDLVMRNDTVVYFDERARVPYLLTDDGYTWVSYENVQSVREKVRFIMDHQLAGYMTWNLNSDDFTGITCSNRRQVQVQKNGHTGSSRELATSSINAFSEAADIDINVGPESSQMPNFPLHRAMFEELHGIPPETNDRNSNNNNNNNINNINIKKKSDVNNNSENSKRID